MYISSGLCLGLGKYLYTVYLDLASGIYVSISLGLGLGIYYLSISSGLRLMHISIV